MNVLAQGVPGGEAVSVAEAVAFWILGPIALAGALGMVFARNAVHSAMWLVLTMLSLGALYMAQGAPFLGFVQIIVYTGAVMMLFLFVLMLAGRDSSDSVVEVLRGQRVAALLFGVGLAVLLVATVGRAFADVTPAGLAAGGANWNGNVPGIGQLLFTRYLLAFELTSALLITAALGAMVLAYAQTRAHVRRGGQRAMVEARLRGDPARISPLPGPGVFATANSVAVPAVLPDGSIAADSLAEIIDRTEVRPAPEPAPDDAHALTGRPLAERGGRGTSVEGGPTEGSAGDGSTADTGVHR
jgi:NADH-quinone oxidoreductase subunit J